MKLVNYNVKGGEMVLKTLFMKYHLTVDNTDVIKTQRFK